MSNAKPKSGNSIALIVCVSILAAGAGFTAALWMKQRHAAAAPTAPFELSQINLTNADGQTRNLSEWLGKLLVINFWASWCEPCREEIPTLIALQNQYGEQGLQVLGPAVEYADTGLAFAADMAINYPIFFGGPATLQMMDRMGDQLGALPFTVLIAPDGSIIDRKSGGLSPSELKNWLAPYVAALAKRQ